MHQKTNAAAASSGSHENGGLADEEGEKEEGEPERPRNPFADDEDDDEEIDSDDGNEDVQPRSGAPAPPSGAWGSSGRGSWWRGVVRSRGGEKFNDRDSDDEDEDEEEEDEEFGDFAMPEVESAPTASRNEKVLLKPLPVHPPSAGTTGGPGGKSALSNLWAFTSQGFGTGAKDEPSRDKERERERNTTGARDEGQEKGGEESVARAVEAKRRTSIEDPDEDEEVVV
jgi:hypothetical protein